jgi:DNA repair protein RecO (recombination protein O)
MALYETESLVLKSYNLAEADRIVVFFTRDQGLVRGVAKGAKRLKSRFGSTLEIFSIVQLSYFQKEERELVSIQNVELIDSCFAQASDPAFLDTFSYIADLLTEFAPPHDPSEKLYRMTKACLESAKADPGALVSLRLYFELWLVRLAGYLPDWTKCDNCRRSFEAGETANMQAHQQLFCQSCAKARGQQIGSSEREVFHSVQKLAPSAFVDSSRDRAASVEVVSSSMRAIVSKVLGKESTSSIRKWAAPGVK